MFPWEGSSEAATASTSGRSSAVSSQSKAAPPSNADGATFFGLCEEQGLFVCLFAPLHPLVLSAARTRAHIVPAYVGCPPPRSHTTHHTPHTTHHTTLRTPRTTHHTTVQGHRKYMEDTCCVLPSLNLKRGPGFSYAAVFDGHGGTGASECCRDTLVSFFPSCLSCPLPRPPPNKT